MREGFRWKKIGRENSLHISGYDIVLINHLEVGHDGTLEMADHSEACFTTIPQDQNPVRLEEPIGQPVKAVAEYQSRNEYVNEHTI